MMYNYDINYVHDGEDDDGDGYEVEEMTVTQRNN